MAAPRPKLRPVSEDLVRRAPKSEADLLKLLSEGLDWPVSSPEEVDKKFLLDWKPEELDLDPEAVAQLKRIRSIRPKDSQQQFGVFLLETTGGRLPTGALRKLLDTLVLRARRSKAGAPHQFDARDLLFVVSGEGGARELHFAVFHEDADKRQSLRVISWGMNETDERIRRLVNNQLPALRWPAVNEMADQWRDDWLQVIKGGYRAVPKSAKALALQMAEVARGIRDEVQEMYEVETDEGATRKLFQQMKERLIADLTPAKFADLYAQTIVYGLLAARIAHQDETGDDDEAHPFENILLDTIYGRLSGEGKAGDPDQLGDGVDLDQLGLHELRDYLATVDVAEILADFGKDEQDPVIHFYEDFVQAYEPGRRLELGIFYTPTPVVRYIIRNVDRRLKEEFGLPMGVADATPWKDVAARLKIDIPAGADPNSPFVSMLDPATGTGTFLVEWISQAEQSFKEVSQKSGISGKELQVAWESHLEKVVIPQMAAFEVELASYSVAHLKVSAALPPAVRGRVRLPIYLTNTLSEPAGARLVFEDDPISEEAARADHVKRDRIVTVIVGNPPYKGKSAKLGGVVLDKATARGGPRMDDFVRTQKFESGSHEKHLKNLYAFFWRWSLWKVFQQSGAGVVEMITSAGWVASPAFPGMRAWLQETADGVEVLDLRGSVYNAIEGDENVFDITIPVAIAQAYRMHGPHDKHAEVRFARLIGTRETKLSELAKTEPVATVQLDDLELGAPFAIQGGSSWSAATPLSDLTPWSQQGMIASRTWVYSPDPQALRLRFAKLIREPDVELKRELFKESDFAKVDIAKPGLEGFPHREVAISEEDDIVALASRCGYRSFDRQWLIADDRVLHSPRPVFWETHSDRQIYMIEQHAHVVQTGPGVVFSAMIPDVDHFDGRGGRALPMYRDAEATQPNITPGLLDFLSESLGVELGVEDLYAYTAGAVAHSGFVARFQEELINPGLRMPLTAEPELFQRVAALGRRVIWLHTYGERFVSEADGRPAGPPRVGDAARAPTQAVEIAVAPAATPEKISFDEAAGELVVGEGRIANVTEKVWLYDVNGMRIVRKWFGYRKRKPAGKGGSPLNEILPSWTEQTTTELIDLLNVLTLVTDLEPEQDQLLAEIVDGPQITQSDLREASVLPVPAAAKRPPAA